MTRIAVIDKTECKNKVDCPFICGDVCPVNRAGKECITVGEDNKPIINEELCIGCGICVRKCPYECLKIINLPEELKAQPIHRYGVNSFALYKLPIPIFGKVVGIIGRNGIGKSTAIKILAGVIKPNLAKEKEATYKELIEYFKGTEAQIFFEKVRDKKIKISYKPQQVDLIPKITKGKVKTLLKKVDEKNQLDKIAKELEITEILDNDITQISGGELQRVAIAATVLKRANLFIFDESTSYLDIKQRLKTAKFIRSLANENTAVLIVEHDIITLDYMTDLIHIMYGKEGCYGVVSQPRATKAGINTYLEGYLKEENIRFRDYKIKFEIKPPVKKKKEDILTSWPNLKKKLNSFELEVESGDINKHETVGVLGENGIGKTTFVKILAGVLKTDEGKIDMSEIIPLNEVRGLETPSITKRGMISEHPQKSKISGNSETEGFRVVKNHQTKVVFNAKIKVSYKPQYLNAESNESVINILRKAIQKYTTQIINPLKIKPLLTKKISELSGGELQRVFIALCLSQDYDLALLDEPSAYLDVEQRFIVSKTIQNLMEERGTSAFIVDHDILFIDYLSDRLLVFEGVPAKHGLAKGPFDMEKGMNSLLKELNITLRREKINGRPRINKPGSVKDRQQKKSGKLYYS